MQDGDKLFMPTLLVAMVTLTAGYITIGALSVGFFWKAGVQQVCFL